MDIRQFLNREPPKEFQVPSDIWKPEVFSWACAQACYFILLIAMIGYSVVFGPALWLMASEVWGELQWFTIEDVFKWRRGW